MKQFFLGMVFVFTNVSLQAQVLGCTDPLANNVRGLVRPRRNHRPTPLNLEHFQRRVIGRPHCHDLDRKSVV